MWTSTRTVPNRFRQSPACAEKQGPKVELHDIERPIDLGCDAGDRASNIACGLGGVEGWRNIFGSLVHNCQSGIRHIRGRRRAYQCSRTAGGHRGRSGHLFSFVITVPVSSIVAACAYPFLRTLRAADPIVFGIVGFLVGVLVWSGMWWNAPTSNLYFGSWISFVLVAGPSGCAGGLAFARHPPRQH